jgi:hypothetical protein
VGGSVKRSCALLGGKSSGLMEWVGLPEPEWGSRAFLDVVDGRASFFCLPFINPGLLASLCLAML